MNSGRRGPSLRTVLLCLAAAVLAISAFWAAGAALALGGEASLMSQLSVGMTEGDVVRRLGPPEKTLYALPDTGPDAHLAQALSDREIEHKVHVYRTVRAGDRRMALRHGKLLLVYVDAGANVTCLFWTASGAAGRWTPDAPGLPSG